MNNLILKELEQLTKKIESNSANITDYQRYEALLTNEGLTHEKIYSFLKRAGFNDWNSFIKARNNNKKNNIEGAIIGGIIGLGLGILIAGLFED